MVYLECFRDKVRKMRYEVKLQTSNNQYITNLFTKIKSINYEKITNYYQFIYDYDLRKSSK